MRRRGKRYPQILNSLLTAREQRVSLSVPHRIATSAASSALQNLLSGSLLATDLLTPDDGLCAIDINHMKQVIHDAAANHAISAAAKSILHKCVFRDTAKGSSYKGLPIGGDLAYVGQCIVSLPRWNRESLF